MSATYTARKLTGSPFVEFYRREGSQAPKRMPISPRLMSAPGNIRISDHGEKVAMVLEDTFPGNTMTTVTSTGIVKWSKNERYVLLGGNAANRARIYERYGADAMLPQVNDDLLPVSPNFILLAEFGGPSDTWLFVRYQGDANTKVRVFRYGYSGFGQFQEITLSHAYTRIIASESTIVFDGGGAGAKTVYRIENGELVAKPLPVGFPSNAVILGVNPEGTLILYHFAATTVIGGNNIGDRYVTTISYDANGDLIDDTTAMNRINLPVAFNGGLGTNAKTTVNFVASGDGKTFILWSPAVDAPLGTPRANFSYYSMIVSVHQWTVMGAVNRHYFSRAGAYTSFGTGGRTTTGPSPIMTPDGMEVIYGFTDIEDNNFARHEMIYLRRANSGANFTAYTVYQRVNDTNGRLSITGFWPAHGHTFGGMVEARAYPTDAYSRRRARDTTTPLPGTIPVNRFWTSVANTGHWVWAIDLLADQPNNISYSPSCNYAIFKRNGVAPTVFEFRRSAGGAWSFAEEYDAAALAVFHTDDPAILQLQGAYALPKDTVISDIVFSAKADAVAFHAEHPTNTAVNGRYALNLKVDGAVTQSGSKINHGTRSRYSFSPSQPLVYAAATFDQSPDDSRVDLFKFNEALTTFIEADDDAGFFGPIAFSACDDVIVVHGGDTGLPFTLYNRNGDTLEKRFVEGCEDFPAEVLDIKYLPDCSGLVVLVPGLPGQPPKVVVIETVDDEETGVVIGKPPIEIPLPEDPDAPPTGVEVGFAEDENGNPIIDNTGQPVISIIVVRENQDIVSPNTYPPAPGYPPLPNQGVGYDPWAGTDPNTGLPVPPAEGQPDEGKKGLIFLDLTGKPVRDGGPEIPRELVDRTYPVLVSMNVGWEH